MKAFSPDVQSFFREHLLLFGTTLKHNIRRSEAPLLFIAVGCCVVHSSTIPLIAWLCALADVKPMIISQGPISVHPSVFWEDMHVRPITNDTDTVAAPRKSKLG